MRQLGQLEAVIMDRVWGYGRPVPVRQVLEDLRRDRRIAYTTVMTVLDNLYRKGFLTREMVARAYRYQPTKTREQHHAAVMEEVLADSSDRAATLMHFLEQMQPDEVIRLREALEQRPASGKSSDL